MFIDLYNKRLKTYVILFQNRRRNTTPRSTIIKPFLIFHKIKIKVNKQPVDVSSPGKLVSSSKPLQPKKVHTTSNSTPESKDSKATTKKTPHAKVAVKTSDKSTDSDKIASDRKGSVKNNGFVGNVDNQVDIDGSDDDSDRKGKNNGKSIPRNSYKPISDVEGIQLTDKHEVGMQVDSTGKSLDGLVANVDKDVDFDDLDDDFYIKDSIADGEDGNDLKNEEIPNFRGNYDVYLTSRKSKQGKEVQLDIGKAKENNIDVFIPAESDNRWSGKGLSEVPDVARLVSVWLL